MNIKDDNFRIITTGAISTTFLGSWVLFKGGDFNICFYGNPTNFKKPNWFRRLLIKIILGWDWVDSPDVIKK